MIEATYYVPDGGGEKEVTVELPESKAEEEYVSRKKALYRKIIDACDECGMTTAGVVAVLREVTDRINICRNSRPMQDIMADMKKSRFYQD